MVLENEGDYASRWAAITSISSKIGCVPQTLHDWVKRGEVDSGNVDRHYQLTMNIDSYGPLTNSLHDLIFK